MRNVASTSKKILAGTAVMSSVGVTLYALDASLSGGEYVYNRY